MLAIFKRDFSSYYKSMLGYVFAAVFLGLSGYFFTTSNILNASGNLTLTFSNISFILIIIVPLLTMRSFTEERKAKSDQLLLTSPVGVPSIVLGKFFSALCMFFIGLAITLVYVLIVGILTDLPVLQTAIGYLGLVLLGAAFIAVGIFISSLTENQLIAAVLTIGVLILLWMIDLIVPSIKNDVLRYTIEYLSPFGHFAKFEATILSLSSIIYFLSFIGLFLFLTSRTIVRKRWAKG